MPKLELNNDYNEKSKRTHSDNTRAKMSAAKKGKERSDETRAKIRAAAIGSIRSDEARAKISAAKLARSPYIYTPAGRFENRFEAAEFYNVKYNVIWAWCKSEKPQHADFYCVEKEKKL